MVEFLCLKLCLGASLLTLWSFFNSQAKLLLVASGAFFQLANEASLLAVAKCIE